MLSNHNHQKKIAVINDMSGFGRCSLAVAIPVISVMKIQCCPVPTSIFSNHTGFKSFFFEDYTDRMQPYIDEWKKLGLSFSGISTGFLGSKEQIQIVLRFLKDFGTEENVIVIDPVMGDYGKTYPTYTPEMCMEMKKLVSHADIITPNLTEACILTDTPYHEDKWRQAEIIELAQKLAERGPGKIVITGIPQGEFIANLCFEKDREPKFLRTHKVGTSRSGTGDVFAAIIAADAVNGVDFQTSVRKASRFVKKCIMKSIEMDLPLTDGVCFEELLGTLK
ncbi:MAG: pyridoxamine kinase [Blautia sp.]|nr:pyridoxamine kinase [Blautia sp.]MDY4000757.1 pyridoxamine kinase [Blautia sp.]